MEASPCSEQLVMTTTPLANTDRATIRAMQIAEVRLMIIELLARADVAKLAAVNTTWFFSCVEALWRVGVRHGMISLRHLLNVAPCRTQLYASFLPGLDIGTTDFNKWVLGRDGGSPQANFSLPQLTTLQAQIHLDGVRADFPGVMDAFSSIFLSPSLKILRLFYVFEKDTSSWPQLPMEASMSRLVNLETLTLVGLFPFVSFSRMIQTLPKLQQAIYSTFAGRGTLNSHCLSKALGHLASRPQTLNHLRIEFPTHYFGCPWADKDPDETATPHESMQSAISKLTLEGMGPLYRRKLLLHTKPTSLEDLTIMLDLEPTDVGVNLKDCNLQVLHRFKNLISLSIAAKIIGSCKLHPDFLLQIAQACPRMEDIELHAAADSLWRLELDKITENVLVELAWSWPNLKRFRLVGDLMSNLRRRAGMKAMMIHCPRIQIGLCEVGRRLVHKEIMALEKELGRV